MAKRNIGILIRVSLSGAQILICFVLSAVWSLAQPPANSSPAGPPNPVERGIDLAATGHCEEALPLLKKLSASESDKQLKYRAQIASARCGIKRKDGQTTVTALLALRHDYPEDPEVLYMTTQVFLEIAEDASQDLARIAPNSHRTLELQAETLESQNKWEAATAIYRKILEGNPKLPDIHFRLGRAALSQPESPTSAEDAKKEFEQELAIDATNASAEFWLGEIARRGGQWEDAISHFSSAAKLDSDSTQALLGLGMALNSAGRFPEAISPLERYSKAVSDDLTGHYQLAMAYARTGRKEDSAREMALWQQLYEKKQAATNSRAGTTPQ